MGLFDYKITELGQTLSTNLIKRSTELEKEWATEKDPGRSLSLKIAYFVFRELATVIQNSLSE